VAKGGPPSKKHRHGRPRGGHPFSRDDAERGEVSGKWITGVDSGSVSTPGDDELIEELN
jgi:hypothetical protein